MSRLLALCIPLCLVLSVPLVSNGRPFQRASQAARLGLVLSLLVAAAGAGTTEGSVVTTGAVAWLSHVVKLDAVTRVMLALVGFIGFVVVRYSRTYLQGAAGQRRYVRALLATLAAVTVLVLASNLLLLSLAWIATSLSLHQLLTFYRDRPQALVVAHKKFLLSRLADACMLGAVALIRATVGSLDLDAVNAWASANEALPLSMQVAALLLVLAVLLKSAQLPFHGWLIQVMEAPTPVSALLHAGVVNIGGFVMIRLSPFMGRATLAQTLLVLAGTTTAVVAALVMSTRVTIKVTLAWSTCAQMGFMLVECGLGLWHLALLHLVAHSLYKAHAFLSAGTAVDVWRVRDIAGPTRPALLSRLLGVRALVLVSVAVTVAAARALATVPARESATLAPLALLLALSLAPLAAGSIGVGLRPLLEIVLRSVAVSALYFGGHVVAARILPVPEPATMPITWLIVLLGFLVLSLAQLLLECRPDGQLADRLSRHLFAGLYLDDRFTRWTFRLWPLPRPRAELPPPILEVRPIEARS